LLVELLLRRGDAELQDGAVMALDVWRSGGRDMAAILRRSVHGRRILALGFEKDLACAGETDVSRSVAQLEEAETGGPVLRTR
jgi:phosphosulfolactate phosphohydrolase-like enzyme